MYKDNVAAALAHGAAFMGVMWYWIEWPSVTWYATIGAILAAYVAGATGGLIVK